MVEHSGSGLKMPEEIARRADELSKGLPTDFHYRRVAKAASSIRFPKMEDGSNSDVSMVTTDDVDRDGEVMLPEGINLDDFRKSPTVFYCHEYTQPVGKCLWIKPETNPGNIGLSAMTRYAKKPADWQGPWLPDAVHSMMQEGIGTGKSIGFIPTSKRAPTADELKTRPDWKNANNGIIDRCVLLEYSVAPLPANQNALSLAVSKALKTGTIDQNIADFLSKTMSLPTTIPPAHSMSHALVRPPPAIAEACMKMARSIPRTSLAEGGRTDDPHIKVMSGMTTDDPEAVAKCLNGEGPVKCMMGKSMHAPMAGRDHVHIPIESDDLKRIAMKMKSLPHLADADMPAEFSKALTDADKPGEFKPLMTLAFTHSGKGEQFAGMDDMDGVGFKCHKLTFANKAGDETDIALTGGEAKVIGHRKSIDRINAKSMTPKLAHLDFTAPAECQMAMRKGLNQHAGYGSGMGGFGSAGLGGADCATPEQLSMATHLSMGGRASPEMVRSIKAFHDGIGAKAGDHADGTPMHTLDLLHGQVHGKKWAKALCKDMDEADGEQEDSLQNPQMSTPTPTEPPILPSAPVVPLDQAITHKPGMKASESGNGGMMVQDSMPMPDCPACMSNTGVTKMATPDGVEPTAEPTAGEGYKCDQCGMKFDAAPMMPAAKSMKGVTLNQAGHDHAMGLIDAGKIDEGPWSFTAEDRAKATPADFLATEDGEGKYPVVKDSKVFKRGVSAAMGRAKANDAPVVAEAASRLSDAITAKLDAKAKSLAADSSARAKALAVERALAAPFATAETLKAAEERELAECKAQFPVTLEAAFGEALAMARGSTD